jgi:hypothetical protein
MPPRKNAVVGIFFSNFNKKYLNTLAAYNLPTNDLYGSCLLLLLIIRLALTFKPSQFYLCVLQSYFIILPSRLYIRAIVDN